MFTHLDINTERDFPILGELILACLAGRLTLLGNEAEECLEGSCPITKTFHLLRQRRIQELRDFATHNTYILLGTALVLQPVANASYVMLPKQSAAWEAKAQIRRAVSASRPVSHLGRCAKRTGKS